MGTDQYGSGYNSGYGADYIGLPFLFRNGGVSDNGSKEAHDSYNVYVNKDFVGNKVLVSQVEKIDDVSKYLLNQGFYDFKAKLEGNQYMISSEGSGTNDMKHTLEVYLNNR
jgi:hypothetical protein